MFRPKIGVDLDDASSGCAFERNIFLLISHLKYVEIRERNRSLLEASNFLQFFVLKMCNEVVYAPRAPAKQIYISRYRLVSCMRDKSPYTVFTGTVLAHGAKNLLAESSDEGSDRYRLYASGRRERALQDPYCINAITIRATEAALAAANAVRNRSGPCFLHVRHFGRYAAAGAVGQTIRISQGPPQREKSED